MSAKYVPAFLKDRRAPPVNLIVVEWSRLCHAPWYNDAAKNTQLVGIKLARFIEFLVEQGISLDQIHLIGHSLGAHVAGFAGVNMHNKTLSRITGMRSTINPHQKIYSYLVESPTLCKLSRRLSMSSRGTHSAALDPALPLFDGVTDDYRIDPSDAAFVDVIHTAGGSFTSSPSERVSLAFMDPRGDADFYVNGGKNQPGCGVDLFGIKIFMNTYLLILHRYSLFLQYSISKYAFHKLSKKRNIIRDDMQQARQEKRLATQKKACVRKDDDGDISYHASACRCMQSHTSLWILLGVNSKPDRFPLVQVLHLEGIFQWQMCLSSCGSIRRTEFFQVLSLF